MSNDQPQDPIARAFARITAHRDAYAQRSGDGASEYTAGLNDALRILAVLRSPADATAPPCERWIVRLRDGTTRHAQVDSRGDGGDVIFVAWDRDFGREGPTAFAAVASLARSRGWVVEAALAAEQSGLVFARGAGAMRASCDRLLCDAAKTAAATADGIEAKHPGAETKHLRTTAVVLLDAALAVRNHPLPPSTPAPSKETTDG